MPSAPSLRRAPGGSEVGGSVAAQRRWVARAAERRAGRSGATGSAGRGGGGGGDGGPRGSAPASEQPSAALAPRRAPPPSPPRAGVRWSPRPSPPPPRRGECGRAPPGGGGWGVTRRTFGPGAARGPGRRARAAALPGRKCGALCGRPGAAPRSGPRLGVAWRRGGGTACRPPRAEPRLCFVRWGRPGSWGPEGVGAGRGPALGQVRCGRPGGLLLPRWPVRGGVSAQECSLGLTKVRLRSGQEYV